MNVNVNKYVYSDNRVHVKNLVLAGISNVEKANSRQLSGIIADMYGVHIDYHIVGDVLDMANTAGIVRVCDHTSDGMTVYKLA